MFIYVRDYPCLVMILNGKAITEKSESRSIRIFLRLAHKQCSVFTPKVLHPAVRGYFCDA